MTSSSTRAINTLATAIVNAMRILTKYRHMFLVDTEPVLRELLIERFRAAENVLDDEHFAIICRLVVCALAESPASEVQHLPMSQLALLVKPMLFVSQLRQRRHRGIRYSVCMLACIAKVDTPLALTMERHAATIERACDALAEERKLKRERVTGHLMLLCHSEQTYDNRPDTDAAAAMYNRQLTPRVTAELWYSAELQFDRLEHVGVMEHVAFDTIPAKQRAEDDYSNGWRQAEREPQNLPLLVVAADVIVRVRGFARNQVVRIKQQSSQLGINYEYRRVV